MKSNVKVAAAAMGLVACKSSPVEGLVVVPMAETASSVSTAIVDAGTDAPPHRVAIEPRAPNNQGCTRDVSCVAELPTPPTYPYAHPFENCNPAPYGEVGHFSPNETTSRRHDDPTLCCYVSFGQCTSRTRVNNRRRVMIGRPLRSDDGAWITAKAIWASPSHDDARIDEERARFWANGGALEHASVAEFARISLALLAHGAPADLLADVHRAALDEIEHARICFALASRFAGRDIGPGALDVTRASTDVSLASLVRDALRDGCVGEADAARELRALAAREPDAEIAAALSVMASDEERHAALAWRIVDFAMTVDDAVTLAEIARFKTRELPQAPREDDCAREA